MLRKCGRKDSELNMSVKIIPSFWYNTKLQLLIEIRIQAVDTISIPLQEPCHLSQEKTAGFYILKILFFLHPCFGPKHRLDNSDLFKILLTLGNMGKKQNPEYNKYSIKQVFLPHFHLFIHLLILIMDITK